MNKKTWYSTLATSSLWLLRGKDSMLTDSPFKDAAV